MQVWTNQTNPSKLFSVANRAGLNLPQSLRTVWSSFKQDLGDKKEGWFLARPDGSAAYRTSEELGKVFERHQKAVGVFGEAKRSHGARVTIGTEMGKENIYFAKQQLRHRDVSTTLASYVAETPEEVRRTLNKVSKGFQKPADFESRNEEKVM